MTRKTGNKYECEECPRCGERHTGYSGKLDKDGIEYVVCEFTHKRINISGHGFTYFTEMGR